MAYDEGLAERIRAVLAADAVDERRMFGGLAFMVAGNMCCGIVGDELMVRVGPEAYAAALADPHAREMDFTGRAMRGMVYVDATGVTEDAALESWVQQGLAYAKSLPPK